MLVIFCSNIREGRYGEPVHPFPGRYGLCHYLHGKRYAPKTKVCVIKLTTPLATARLLEIFRKEALFLQEYKDFIYQTMTECQTGQDRLVAPLLGKDVTIGHKTGTGDRNAKGQQVACNDIGFVLLPDGRAYSSRFRQRFRRE